MLISGREAVRILLTRGAMTGEAQARSLLRTGAAGWGTVTDTGVYFESAGVVALADRPWLSEPAQQAACPEGAYLARVARTVPLDLTRPWPEVAASLAVVPRMPPMTGALLVASISAQGHGAQGHGTQGHGARRHGARRHGARRHGAQASGRLPWVALFHGFVVLGADLVGLRTDDEGVSTFLLEPPGEWFDAWHETRVSVTRGGRPWVIRLPRAG